MSDDKDPLKNASDEITKPIIDELSSRLKAPFFGGFIFSWIIINWEKIAILISSKENIYTRIDKIKNIEQLHLPIIGTWHTSTFFIPLISSILITLITPFITLAFKKMQQWANVRIIDTQAELNNRYKITSASEQLKLELKENEISKIKYSTEKLTIKHTEIVEKISVSEGSLIKINAKISDIKKEYEQIVLDVDSIRSVFDGYKKPSDLVDKLTIENEKHKENLIKANETINELDDNLGELKTNSSILKRDINIQASKIIELDSNHEMYKDEIMSSKKFINELIAETEVIIYELKEYTLSTDKTEYISEQIERIHENLKLKQQKINQITSIE